MRPAIKAAPIVFTFLLAVAGQMSGNAAAGKAIFDGKGRCLDCHSISTRGGSLGPDLTDIGVRRDTQSLRLALTDPNAEIAQNYLTIVLTTSQGERVEGIRLNEDDITIQVRDTQGNPRSFLKDNLRDLRREQRSLMPSYASKLSPAELDDIVAYLRTLRGDFEPALAVPRKRVPGPLTKDTSWLTRANRDGQERPDMLIENLRIPAGATVVDLGAGTGYFTWRLSERVGPAGKVIAVDIQKNMLDLVAKEARKRGLGNVELVAGGESDPHLPPGVADLVFIANSYHEFSQPEAMMAAVRRVLKPNGRVVVIEYATEVDEDPTAGVYTMTLEELRSEIEPLGFQLERILDFLPLQHGLIFTTRPR